ncbi:MAG: TRAP transporter substrate-binding protein DctP [Candidatus Thorarchaeota archaeon]|nr:TRAP transporter substrate-binding protein DctP [Candidatus Thorarchaeota archaeon]
MYISIQQGTVDGQENPIPTIHVNKFHEVAKYVSLTNHIYGPIPICMNDKRWQSLSAADQAAVVKAAPPTTRATDEICQKAPASLPALATMAHSSRPTVQVSPITVARSTTPLPSPTSPCGALIVPPGIKVQISEPHGL